eukprot:g1671.t1
MHGGTTATIDTLLSASSPVHIDGLTIPVRRQQLVMFKSFFKKIDSTVRERLGKSDSPSDGSQSKKPAPKKDTSAIKVPSLVKANDTLKNMSTTLKSSFSRRKARKDEIGREFVEARMVRFEKACVNNRIISSKSENLAKVSTAQCSRLKRKRQSWENFESELLGLTDIDKGIKQISIDVENLHSHLERVETLLEEVCVLDISLQHLKWERKLENSLKSHKQLESVKLLRKQGEKRASDLSKDISSNFSRLLRSASASSTDSADQRKTSVSIDGPDSGAMKTENSSEGDGKDTGAPKQVDDAKEGDSDDDSGDDDEEFDPASLYND